MLSICGANRLPQGIGFYSLSTKMSLKQKIGGIALAILAAFGIGQNVHVGSVVQGSEYQATTSVAIWANVPHVIATSTSGSLDVRAVGSIVFGTPDSTIVQVMDATSSTDVSSTTIAVIGANPATGTPMTLDVSIKRGLIINTQTGFAGRYTITYR